jgi:hypothetical protein
LGTRGILIVLSRNSKPGSVLAMDQQLERIDFFETYAPVVQWTMICLIFILEILLGLKSMQGDITCAFLHTDLKENELFTLTCQWDSPSMKRMERNSALNSKRHSMGCNKVLECTGGI